LIAAIESSAHSRRTAPHKIDSVWLQI
jgi:hypothetical protein